MPLMYGSVYDKSRCVLLSISIQLNSSRCFFVLLYICSIYCGPSIQLFNYSSDSFSLFLSFFCYWFWGVLFNQNQFHRIWFLPVNVLDSIEFWCLMSYFNDIPKYSLYMFIIQSANIVNNNFLSPLCMPYYVRCIVRWSNTLIFARTRTCKIPLWLEFIYSSHKNKTQSTVTFWFSTRCFSFYCHILCTLYKIAKNIHTKNLPFKSLPVCFSYSFFSLFFSNAYFSANKRKMKREKNEMMQTINAFVTIHRMVSNICTKTPTIHIESQQWIAWQRKQ